ncbi:uncharacterized protein LOC100835085 [Brachypodium distachyon]|uniref:Uncharacterized protein n=1 Tax=Brachypodium distachyon TaxID=15368 RepID=A0A0Q3NLU4_BRADI|nr:uncharacterized protein LOC100835085 [Brachypodium distachyon]KQK18446.1 hypothetical protein BRADI_1g42530v3 [Brachypodium distachyon]|eukprot:XP_003563889.2 uncharacterized protein LOC100835085 [Brachypodium distachyon]
MREIDRAMGARLLQAVAGLMSTCTRRVQRAARRMGSASGNRVVAVPWRKAFSLPSAKSGKAGGKGKEEGGGGGLWRKEILMGERCQPLEFSGVIYYDADGRILSQPPRSPMRSPRPAYVAANAGLH